MKRLVLNLNYKQWLVQYPNHQFFNQQQLKKFWTNFLQNTIFKKGLFLFLLAFTEKIIRSAQSLFFTKCFVSRLDSNWDIVLRPYVNKGVFWNTAHEIRVSSGNFCYTCAKKAWKSCLYGGRTILRKKLKSTLSLKYLNPIVFTWILNVHNFYPFFITINSLKRMQKSSTLMLPKIATVELDY